MIWPSARFFLCFSFFGVIGHKCVIDRRFSAKCVNDNICVHYVFLVSSVCLHRVFQLKLFIPRHLFPSLEDVIFFTRAMGWALKVKSAADAVRLLVHSARIFQVWVVYVSCVCVHVRAWAGVCACASMGRCVRVVCFFLCLFVCVYMCVRCLCMVEITFNSLAHVGSLIVHSRSRKRLQYVFIF